MHNKTTFLVRSIIISITVLFSQNIFAQDLLEMNLEDLLNISVTTASKSAEKQSDAPGVLSVLSNDELTRFGGTTLRDVLERMPGLAISGVYMTDRSMISARGDQFQASSGHVLLLINGRPVRESLEGGIKSDMMEAFPVNIIDRIEVIRGPGSVLYGSDAFTAVINVITKKAEETGVSITGLVGTGYDISGSATISTGDFKLLVGGKLLKKTDWETSYIASSPEGPITLDYTLPSKGNSVFANASYSGLNATLSYTKFEHGSFLPDYGSIGNSFWEKLHGNLGYDVQLSDNWTSSVNLTYTNSIFEIEVYPLIKRDSYEILGELTNFITLSDKSKLVIGGLFSKIDGGETFWALGFPIPISDANRSSYSFYGQIDYMLLDNLKAIGGVQANKIGDLDLDFGPRVGLIFHPSERFTIKALYSTAFRAPSINEFNLAHPTLHGNPDLKPEKVGTFDLSLGYSGEQGQIALNYFNSSMTQVIIQDRSTNPALYANGGEITLSGVELEGKYYIDQSWYLSGSMLYHSSEDADGNKDITPIANFGLKAGISYQWNGGVTVSLFDIFQGEPEESFTVSPNPAAGSYNVLNLHSKFDLTKLLNLNWNQDLALVLQVDNLLNQEIWIPAWGMARGQSMPHVQGMEIFAGLNFSL